METKSPASTSGASQLVDAQVIEVVPVSTRANVNLLGYTPAEEDPQFELIELDYDVTTMKLTHPSATAGYAVFRSDCIAMGIPPVNFAVWLRAATSLVTNELEQKKVIPQKTAMFS